MKREEITFARINWKKFGNLKRALGSDWASGFGLYQIYGRHIVFGEGSLLYVGRASEQTLGERIGQHSKWLEEEQDVVIHLGSLNKDDYGGGSSWSKLNAEAEALTIYWHSPPYNSQNINRYGGRPLCVQNTGERGSLLPEYTSLLERFRDLE